MFDRRAVYPADYSHGASTESARQALQFQLRTTVTRAGGLAQQLVTDTTVTGIATITAQQLAQPTLRLHATFQCWLLEQVAGQTFGTGRLPKARVVEQPERDAHGNVGTGRGRCRERSARHKYEGVTAGARHSTPFFAEVKTCQSRPIAFHEIGSAQSTEAVDNSVNNLGERGHRPDAMGLSVKLSIFSPTKKVHIFH